MGLRTVMGLVGFVLVAVAAFLGWGREILRNHDDPLREPFVLVVVLAGPLDEDGGRVAAGVRLAGASDDCLLLLPLRHRALTWPWFVRRYSIEDPLPEERVILGHPEEPRRQEGTGLGGTFAEACKTIAVMRERGIPSAVVVTSGYHIRRARLAFERANAEPRLFFQFHAVDSNEGEAGRWWWLDLKSVARVADEYLKLAGGYWIYR